MVYSAGPGPRSREWTYPGRAAGERQYGNTTGINVNNPAQLGLLTQPISSPAVIAAFPALANPNNVYPGFPSYEPLNQALRPVPQWIGVPPFLGPPLGDTWYDSLQVKLTKRYSHGLTVAGSYTFQKEHWSWAPTPPRRTLRLARWWSTTSTTACKTSSFPVSTSRRC